MNLLCEVKTVSTTRHSLSDMGTIAAFSSSSSTASASFAYYLRPPLLPPHLVVFRFQCSFTWDCASSVLKRTVEQSTVRLHLISRVLRGSWPTSVCVPFLDDRVVLPHSEICWIHCPTLPTHGAHRLHGGGGDGGGSSAASSRRCAGLSEISSIASGFSGSVTSDVSEPNHY